jgi:peptidoglycan/LPS O-acetylase OafA/YrhL
VAILSVVCTHSWLAGGMGDAFDWITTYGWMGVDLFFVLSGYLIGRQLLARFQRDGRLDLKAFYRQRAYRILPAYLVVVAFYFCFPSLRELPAIQPLWQFLTFTMNLFVVQDTGHAFSSAWSLCVEEHFYLVFPLAVLAVAPHASARRIGCLIVGLCVAGMIWRGFAWWQSAAPSAENGIWEMNIRRYMEMVYYPTYARLDGLLAGITLAIVSVHRKAWWERIQQRPNGLAIAGASVVGISTWIFDDVQTLIACVVGFPLLSIGLALLVAAGAAPGGVLAKVRVPGAGWMAAVSYSLYLSHKAVLSLAFRHLPAALTQHGVFTFACCLFAALCVAALLHYLVERPFLRLRDRKARSSMSPAVA